jgi:hypothetical protein
VGDKSRAFTDFKFQLGQLVRHKAGLNVGVITNRLLIQAQTGNTGNGYMVSYGVKGELSLFVLEIELEELRDANQ